MQPFGRSTEYCIRALGVLDAAKGQPLYIQEIADEGKIPKKFLEQLMIRLRKANMVEVSRGIGGGCRLQRPVDEITLAEVVRAAGGTKLGVDDDEPVPDGPGMKKLRKCADDINSMIRDVMVKTTVADLLGKRKRKTA